MRVTFYTLVILSTLALGGTALATAEQAETPAAPAEQEAAPAAAPAPVFNPMGAGLMVPAGEAKSPVPDTLEVPVYEKPDLQSKKLGFLRASGSDIPFQMHAIIDARPDPKWEETWWRRWLGRKAPIIKKEVKVSEFTLSPTQRGVMIVNVQGSWLQLANGWFQWTVSLAENARFKPWSELYQEASFSAFQLTNARVARADIVPVTDVTVIGEGEAAPTLVVKPPTRFIVVDSAPAALKLRITGGTCKGSKPDKHEGAEGWVALFAQNGAPQVILQPETCPEEMKPGQ
jgi:hypothetical protein